MAPARFPTTRWSVVLAAGGAGTPDARAALEELCQAYWYPLYALARRRGRPSPEAEDAVQGFFARLLARDAFERADPDKGRFRSYLRAAFCNHLKGLAARESAAKRGGGASVVSLDVRDAERRVGLEPAHERSPEHAFERDWALSILHGALETVRAGYAGRGQAALFEALEAHLVPGAAPASQAELARALAMREGAVRVAIHRLRRRFRDALVDAVAQTIEDRPEALEEELQALLAALEGA